MEVLKKSMIVWGVLLILGCQGNDPFDRESNPFPKDLKNYTPEQPEALDTQAVKVKTYDVSANGEVNASKILHFVAGESGEYTINGRSFVDQTQFSLKGHNLPAGAELTADATNPGNWKLTWTPPVTVIPNGQRGVDLDISIEFVLAEGTSLRAQNAHAAFEKMTNFRLTVRHSDQQPVITSAGELDSTSSLSETTGRVSFNLTIVDPMSNAEFPPELWPEFQLDDSDTSLPGNMALQKTGSPEFRGGGQWVIPMALDLNLLGDHYRRNGENGKRININVSMLAESTVTDNESPVWSKTLSVQLLNKESK